MAPAHSRGASLDAAGDAAFRPGLCLWGKGWGPQGVSWVRGRGKPVPVDYTDLSTVFLGRL